MEKRGNAVLIGEHEFEFELNRQEHPARYLILFAMQDGLPQSSMETLSKVKVAAEAIGRPFTTPSASTARDDLVGDRVLVGDTGKFTLTEDKEKLARFDPA